MRDILFVFLGGGLGSVARYIISLVINKNGDMPWHTLIANLVGCAIIGLLTGYLVKSSVSWLTLLAITGFCGGFTTLSTFSIETFHYFKNGEITQGITYSLISLLGCLISTGAGYFISLKFLQN